jgi:hypothetical protein
MSGLPKVETLKHRLKLPSSGETIEYRPYLVKEEKILMLALESNDNSDMIDAVKRVIESCTNGTLNEKNMTMFDLEYFFTNLRSKSVGETSEIKSSCPECGEYSSVEVNLNDIEIDVPQNKDHYIRSIDDNIKVRMSYPSIGKTLELIDETKSDVDLAYELVVASILEIYNGDEVYDASNHSKQDLMDFIDSLSSTQFEDIKSFVEDSPTVTVSYHHNCQSCEYDGQNSLSGFANFFG